MKEIVSVHLGQCGNQIATKFWELISCEHGINYNGAYVGESNHQFQRLGVYFNETSNRYTPRAVLVDLEPTVLESIRSRESGKLFKPDNFISGIRGGGNNFGKGFYGEGLEISEPILDVIRKEAEHCDCLQGFQFVHSLGGGTGSGLGSLLLDRTREEYTDRIICTHSVIPSLIQDVVTEPYNTVLSMNYLIENNNETFVMDNQALFNICKNQLETEHPSYSNINHLICNTMSGITASSRFPGQLNTNLHKLAVNLIPFPRLHFLIPAFAPIFFDAKAKYRTFNTKDILSELHDNKNLMADLNLLLGKFLTTAVLYRGKVSSKVLEEQVTQIRQKNNPYYVDYLQNSATLSMCDIPGYGLQESATYLCNSTSIRCLIENISKRFTTMFEKKAYLHWYSSEGIDDSAMKDAQEQLQALTDEYWQYQEATGDDLEEGDEFY